MTGEFSFLYLVDSFFKFEKLFYSAVHRSVFEFLMILSGYIFSFTRMINKIFLCVYLCLCLVYNSTPAAQVGLVLSGKLMSVPYSPDLTAVVQKIIRQAESYTLAPSRTNILSR